MRVEGSIPKYSTHRLMRAMENARLSKVQVSRGLAEPLNGDPPFDSIMVSWWDEAGYEYGGWSVEADDPRALIKAWAPLALWLRTRRIA